MPDDELVAVLLGSLARRRSAVTVARELVRSSGGLGQLSRSTVREISRVTGVGAERAARIAAAFELGRRAVATTHRRDVLGGPDDVYRLVHTRTANLAQELFFVIGIDIRNQLLDCVEVARGSVAGVEVHPREIFRPLIRMAASAGVLVHNHPSGDATPSEEDIALTRRLRAIGDLLAIPIIDHVVIGQASYRSLAEDLGTEL